MGNARVSRLLAFGTLVLLFGASSEAQNTSTSQPPPPDAPRVYRTTGSRIAIGRSIQVPTNEEVTDAVVVIGGSLRVDGRVRDNVVVVGGNLDFGPTAEVGGDAVVVGGSINRAEGARLHGSVSDVSFGEWTPWSFGGFWIPMIDFGDFGRWFALFGALFRISMLAVLMGIILLVARAPVARIGQAAASETGRAFLAGLAAEILFLPALIMVSVALMVTIIGIPFVIVLLPVAFLTACLALVLGFTSVATRLGEWLEDRLGIRAHSALIAAALGLLVIVGPTLVARMIGVGPWPMRVGGWGLLLIGMAVEFVVWTIGLGATLMTGFGRWSIAPPPVPPPAPMPVVVNA